MEAEKDPGEQGVQAEPPAGEGPTRRAQGTRVSCAASPAFAEDGSIIPEENKSPFPIIALHNWPRRPIFTSELCGFNPVTTHKTQTRLPALGHFVSHPYFSI